MVGERGRVPGSGVTRAALYVRVSTADQTPEPQCTRSRLRGGPRLADGGICGPRRIRGEGATPRARRPRPPGDRSLAPCRGASVQYPETDADPVTRGGAKRGVRVARRP
jgi:hypothetical protein